MKRFPVAERDGWGHVSRAGSVGHCCRFPVQSSATSSDNEEEHSQALFIICHQSVPLAAGSLLSPPALKHLQLLFVVVCLLLKMTS